MSKEMQAVLTEHLAKLLATVEKGTAFAGEQIPLIIQEKLTFDFYWALIEGLIYLVTLPLALLACKWLVNYESRNWESDNPIPLIGMFFTGLYSLWALIGIIVCGNKAIYIHLAPRLYILDWLKEIVK